jgi:hypothetical protein
LLHGHVFDSPVGLRVLLPLLFLLALSQILFVVTYELKHWEEVSVVSQNDVYSVQHFGLDAHLVLSATHFRHLFHGIDQLLLEAKVVEIRNELVHSFITTSGNPVRVVKLVGFGCTVSALDFIAVPLRQIFYTNQHISELKRLVVLISIDDGRLLCELCVNQVEYLSQVRFHLLPRDQMTYLSK